MNDHDKHDTPTPQLPAADTGMRRRSLLQALTLGAGAATLWIWRFSPQLRP